MSGRWRDSRVALIAAALALLAGIPGILAAAGIKNPWVLGGAAGFAAVVVVFAAVSQDRYIRLAKRRDEQGFRTEDGCLVLADGRLPSVRHITDPVQLGVHRAALATVPVNVAGAAERAGDHVPAYVPRDVDTELRERLAAGGFVLLVGDSAAGKSRAAFEAMAVTLPGHELIVPASRDAVSVAVTRAAHARQCVLWLDDLEAYLGTGGLTAVQVGRLITGTDGHRVVIATLRAAEQARLTADPLSGDDAASQVRRDTRQVLDQAHTIRIERMFTGPELGRARARDWDPRIAEALDHSGTYGIAEYLAAGPELLRDWDDAVHSSAGPNARGAALVAAAVDIRRAGHISPVSRALLEAVHESYLDDPEHVRTPRESLADAWAWAVRQRRATTALLQPTAGDRAAVFDYLVDAVQRRTPAGVHVPEAVVRAAIDSGDPADLDSVAATAYAQGRYLVAEYAYRQGRRAKADSPDLGAEHPDTLNSRSHLALVLADLGRLEEAEAENRAVLEIMTRVLGAQHPDTLNSRSNLAVVMAGRGRLEEAEAENRAVLQIRARVLGTEHPGTLNSRSNLALVMAGRGRLEEAEAENRAVLQIRARALGADHPNTLFSRNNLALVLSSRGRLEEARSNLALVLASRGRLEEAEAENRLVLQIRARALGAEHPDTLTSRSNLALVLADLGQLDDAEAENRAVLEIRTRVLGTEHPDTLTSRSNLASVLGDLGRLEDAEAEHRAEMTICARVLGIEHPDTLNSRSNLASVLADLGRLEEAEAENRAVLEIMTRVLGAEHPDTLNSRSNLASVLADLGRLQEAETENRAVLEIMTRVLGAQHPDTLNSRSNLVLVLANRDG
jgi:tetratricopeptide (TPR) repeat protein